MTPEQFIRKYQDTHTELEALEHFQKNKSLVKYEPGDKNIEKKKAIPGKHLIESIETEKRAEGLQHVLLDACSARIKDLMDIPMEKLVGLTIKTLPQKIDGKMEHSMTFADIVRKASIEIENYEDIDVE